MVRYAFHLLLGSALMNKFLLSFCYIDDEMEKCVNDFYYNLCVVFFFFDCLSTAAAVCYRQCSV